MTSNVVPLTWNAQNRPYVGGFQNSSTGLQVWRHHTFVRPGELTFQTSGPGQIETKDLSGVAAHFESDVCAATEKILGVELLRELPEGGYRLLRPLPLTVYRAPAYYWVAPDGFVLHGIGSTAQEAVKDYGYALLDYYEELRKQKDLLAPHLLEHLEYLETIIARE